MKLILNISYYSNKPSRNYNIFECPKFVVSFRSGESDIDVVNLAMY